jgi:hypothetical protein
VETTRVKVFLKFGHLVFRFTPKPGEHYSLAFKAKEADFIDDIEKTGVERFEVCVSFKKALNFGDQSLIVFGDTDFRVEDARELWDKLMEMGFHMTGNTAKAVRAK